MKKLFRSSKNLKNKSGAGFTIIELLVVVAIIAVLAAIVLVNVTQYINKGKDAAIRGNMATILTNMAVYYDDNGDYDGFTGSNSFLIPEAAINGAKPQSLVTDTTTNFNKMCVCGVLYVGAPDTYCVDDSGYKNQTVTACATRCTGDTGRCTN